MFGQLLLVALATLALAAVAVRVGAAIGIWLAARLFGPDPRPRMVRLRPSPCSIGPVLATDDGDAADALLGPTVEEPLIGGSLPALRGPRPLAAGRFSARILPRVEAERAIAALRALNAGYAYRSLAPSHRAVFLLEDRLASPVRRA